MDLKPLPSLPPQCCVLQPPDPIQRPVENKHKEGRRQIEGENVETVADFIFLGSKVTVDGDCSHEIKRSLLFGRNAMIHLDSTLKSKRHHFADKLPYGQSYVFSSSHV